MPASPVGVFGLQTKLASRSGSGAVFNDIANLVWLPAVLAMAWLIVSRSRGRKSAGIDGLRVADVLRDGAGVFLMEIASLLKTRSYEFAPLREVVVPKDGGGERKLRIATVRDRVVLVALRLVFEPIFDVRMSTASFGYRPGRSVADAIYNAAAHLGEIITLGGGHVISADLADAFGALGQKKLLDTISKVVPDRRLLGLVDASLRAGVLVHEHLFEVTPNGVPQGTPLAALLFNIGMMPIDRWLDSLQGLGVRWTRFADDIMILVPGPASSAKLIFAEFRSRCGKLGLTVSEEKTRIDDAKYGFSFLGSAVIATSTPDGITYQVDPSEKSLRRFHSRMKAAREAQNQNKLFDLVMSFGGRFPHSDVARQAIELARKEVQLVPGRERRVPGGTTFRIPRPNGHALRLPGRHMDRSGSLVPPV